MASYNRVILMGNLTRDPELRYIASGTAVTDIGLAINDRRKNANGEWVEETTFVDVTLWGRTAEVAGEYLSKGSPVFVDGRLKLDEWQDKVTELVHGARDIVVKHPITQEPGHRVPIFGVIDSITGSETDESMQAMEKEGHAKDRGYEGASRANKIGSFLRALQFGGTCLSMGIVRHLTQAISDGSFASKFDDKEKEAGGSLANFKASVSLRLNKGGKFSMAEHPAMPLQGPPVEGYPVRMECKFSCLGPDINRSAFIDVMWQFVELPNGSPRQIIVYDWGGALAQLLYRKKYGEHKAFAYDIDRLEKVLMFTEGPKTNTVRCPELAKEGDPVTKDDKPYMCFTEFGKRIEANPEIAKRVCRFLNISDYPSFQEAEIDWTPPQHTEAKEKKK